MVGFLIAVVVVLGLVAIGQMMRVHELARELKGGESPLPTVKENKMQAVFFIIFLGAFYWFYYWLVKNFGEVMLPPAASLHGAEYDQLMSFNMVIINIVFIITHIVLVLFLYKYYGNKKRKAVFYPVNHKLELIWTVVPALVLAVIIIWGLRTWNDIMDEAGPEAVTIELYAKQFDWTARYAGEDGTLGGANYLNIRDANTLGLDSTDMAGKDDVMVKGEFHIPVGREVNFVMRSQDVIHSAYMPHFRAQMNCVPGMTTKFRFTPTMTTEEMRVEPHTVKLIERTNRIREARGDEPIVFDYLLLCNKICGASHYNMQMTIIVDTEEDYQQWLSEQKTVGEAGIVNFVAQAVEEEAAPVIAEKH